LLKFKFEIMDISNLPADHVNPFCGTSTWTDCYLNPAN
jgi:hypothetical protein